MTTIDSVFLDVTATAITIFFIIGLVVLVLIWKLIRKIRFILSKAEETIDSFENASETIKNIGQNASGPMLLLKIIKSIIKVASHNNNPKGKKD